MTLRRSTRRDFLRGVAATTLLRGCGPLACVLNPLVTKGPYWVDEKLQRANLVDGRAGLPLKLRLDVRAITAGACVPLQGAQVDVWHCDADGLYSDTKNDGLRGYQVTDEAGRVEFQTIYPGWFKGRTVHVHAKVRLFEAGRGATTEATMQLFFDDAITDAVYAAAAPYNLRGARGTRNAGDMIFGDNGQGLLDLAGDTGSGFVASASLGVQMGPLSAG